MVFDTEGHFALLRAVSAGRPRQVRLLLESGIGVNHANANGQSPLIRAMFVENSRYRMKIIRMLLRRGASVAHRDYLGRSALAWACLRGLDCVVEVLLKKADGDINLNDTDVSYCTPLFHAATSGNAATTKLLVDALRRYDLSVDISNEDGLTPLMQAIRLGNDVCASILLHQGKASVSIRDNNRRSALDWAEATTTHCHIKTNFLPLIEKSKIERPKAGKSGRRGRFISVSSMNDSDSSDNESRYSHDAIPKDGNQLDGDDMSEFSDDKSLCSCSSSQTSSSCESSPETIRRMFCRSQISSCKESRCPSLTDSSDVFNADLTAKHRPDQKHLLPLLYSAYSVQLTDTFRPGYQPSSARAPSADGDHDHDGNCQLECCTTAENGIELSEEKILKVVQANRKQRENQSKQNPVTPRRATQSSRLPSLRRQVTIRRFREAYKNHLESSTNQINGHAEQSSDDVIENQTKGANESDEQKQTFPSISPGKRSLVGIDNAEKSGELLKKDIDKILSSSANYISI
ncbi:ankyrin repeat domain-containing protein 55-like [Lytechinus pictus]|uniref:ankyrin repeat domain-containing protein 55-like n=1 Tax=Lytechinus pictus TaxID=7653 RepID=UPI0030B9D7BD